MLLAGPAAASVRHFTWRGVALGAEAQIQLIHDDESRARVILDACVREIDRLENIFSLYRPESTVSRLNRQGRILVPELEFVELLAAALQISRETDGAFDVTVQPLWTPRSTDLPTAQQLDNVLRVIGFQHIDLSSRRVALARKGMALTFNGIAQGYITDRVAGLLAHEGCSNVLVHMGETYGAGSKSDGNPWRAKIGGTDETVALRNRALATSGAADGPRLDHLFDPHTGRAANNYRSVSVTAPTATVADALSTAFCMMEPEQIIQVLARHQHTTARLTTWREQVVNL